jgi:C1A family cysteine protease
MENIANDEKNNSPRTEEKQDSEIEQIAIRSDTDVEKQRIRPRTPSIFKMRRRTGSSMSFRRQFTSRSQGHSDNKGNLQSSK